MIKIKVFVYMAILTLALTGCGKEEPDQLTVYFFSGENEQLTVSNGVIVLNGTEEIFAGGDLKVTGDLPADITSYSTTFYTMSGSERDVILSNSTVAVSYTHLYVPETWKIGLLTVAQVIVSAIFIYGFLYF